MNVPLPCPERTGQRCLAAEQPEKPVSQLRTCRPGRRPTITGPVLVTLVPVPSSRTAGSWREEYTGLCPGREGVVTGTSMNMRRPCYSVLPCPGGIEATWSRTLPDGFHRATGHRRQRGNTLVSVSLRTTRGGVNHSYISSSRAITPQFSGPSHTAPVSCLSRSTDHERKETDCGTAGDQVAESTEPAGRGPGGERAGGGRAGGGRPCGRRAVARGQQAARVQRRCGSRWPVRWRRWPCGASWAGCVSAPGVWEP